MAQPVTEIFTENPIFRSLFFYIGILVLKMMAMSVLTSIQRVKNKAFANPEDAKNLKVKVKVDDNVERVRRAHLNDLENITLFFIISVLYTLTNPSAFIATWLFRIYTAARIIHTIVYAVVVIPQPARALAWSTGYSITAYMAVTTVWHFAN